MPSTYLHKKAEENAKFAQDLEEKKLKKPCILMQKHGVEEKKTIEERVLFFSRVQSYSDSLALPHVHCSLFTAV